ncbi:hypothetical protein B0H21DRAFT_780214 [Amylocystis lapponica]|nr:hypothetical protein B0H21DRAFT_780214 [Amylocystis lapponica]
MVIVDTTGIHHIPVWWCGSARHGTIPASHRRIKSCFTFWVLDDFLLDNLECKTSALNFYSKLRRTTNSTFADQVPNHYQELLRVSRQWGHMKDMMRHGFGYPGHARPGLGDLTFFCVACPQPGVNLPPEWKEDENQLIYTRGFMMDGNFSAEHLKMRRPANDVAISDGTGFMVGEGRYKAHLKVANEVKLKSSCNNHKARVILLYDINCQYRVHLRQRFTESPYLHMPCRLEIVQGIGLFHVHGHQDTCFMRYSPTFIPGAGLVDGAILETLWSC